MYPSDQPVRSGSEWMNQWFITILKLQLKTELFKILQ